MCGERPAGREAADLPPEAHRHEVGDYDREGPVDVRLLRQVGDVVPRDLAEGDPSFERAERAGHPLQHRGLAGSVGSDDGRQAALVDLAVQAMHGRLPVVAEAQVLKLEGVGHGPPGVDVAQKNAPQSAATIRTAPSSRGPAPSGSSRIEGVRGPSSCQRSLPSGGAYVQPPRRSIRVPALHGCGCLVPA